MGSITSKSKKPKFDSFSPSQNSAESDKAGFNQRNFDGRYSCYSNGRKPVSSTHCDGNQEISYVFKRRGSMFIDEEGSVAHEFYEEVIPSDPGGKPYMKRQYENLTPQGDVEYDFPRLSGDCDIILCDP